MSLISEALRKARQSAAEQDVRQRGRLYRSTVPLTPRRHGGGSKLLIGAALGIALGLCVAVAAWFILERDHGTLEAPLATAGDRPASAAPAAEAPIPPDAVATTPTDPPPEVTAETTERVGVGSPETPKAAAEAGPPTVETAIENLPRSEPLVPTLPAPPPTAADGERIFVIDADLGHVTLSLGYIVFRSVDPFAEINGIDVRKGSIIEGFMVERIEADRVVLRDGDGTLVLRVP